MSIVQDTNQQVQVRQQTESTRQEAVETYSQAVKETAKRGVYEFEYVDGPKAGQKVTLPRHKISVGKMTELERLRAVYNNLIARQVDGKNDDGEKMSAADKLTEIYTKCAEYYFGITKEDFILMDWDSSRVNLDAAATVSVFGRPNVAQS